MDLEFLEAIHSLKRREALQRDLGRARDELEELGAVGLVKGSQRPPEPLDLRRGTRGQENRSSSLACPPV